MTWFRMLDLPSAPSRPCIAISGVDEARRWNTPEHGYGIFATVNRFAGPRRKANLVRINAWPVDIDAGSKDAQRARLLGAPLIPSLIVETKRGFQAYWRAKDAKPEHWDALVLERIVPYFGADPNARDLCRILRVPGFLHLKNPDEPFLCRAVWRHDVAYTERQFVAAFPWVPSRERHDAGLAEAQAEPGATSLGHARPTEAGAPSESLWEAIYQLDARETLARLSGSAVVGGESYTFRRNGNGRWNIHVDGKSTSCFVDEQGHIGSLSGGGPTPVQWLRWLGVSWVDAIAALKAAHPHLAEIDAAQRRAWRAA